MAVLTLDLGTTATKAALWDGPTLVGIGRAAVATEHPGPGRAEQQPTAWWESVVEAAGSVRARHRAVWDTIDAVGFSAARETFACFDADLTARGAGILWSDSRAGAEATALADPEDFRARTGVVLNGACCAAKVAWVAEHDATRFDGARWVLASRDWIAARLTGSVRTDRTLASRTGWYDLDGTVLAGDALAARVPPVVPSTTVVGEARGLDLPAGTVVVLGAGDRACEVLGVGAGPRTPMVSWGTTTNVSVPHPGPRGALPGVAAVSIGARSGFVVEAGISAGGAAMNWLARLTGQPEGDLLAAAAAVAPGADGALALPWLHGARGPWWRADVHASFSGLTAAHGPGHLARAVVEAVALDVARCVALVAPDADAIALAGGGAAGALWRTVVAATTGLPVVRRSIDDAASVGARLVVAHARNEVLTVDDLNPVAAVEPADPELVARYVAVRQASDAAARAALGGTPRT